MTTEPVKLLAHALKLTVATQAFDGATIDGMAKDMLAASPQLRTALSASSEREGRLRAALMHILRGEWHHEQDDFYPKIGALLADEPEATAEARATQDAEIAALREALTRVLDHTPGSGAGYDFWIEDAYRVLRNLPEAAKQHDERVTREAVAPWREALMHLYSFARFIGIDDEQWEQGLSEARALLALTKALEGGK